MSAVGAGPSASPRVAGRRRHGPVQGRNGDPHRHGDPPHGRIRRTCTGCATHSRLSASGHSRGGGERRGRGGSDVREHSDRARSRQTRSSSAPVLPASSPRPSWPPPGKRVILLDQEPEQSLGGQAFWSFGGLFLVNSPEQRRLRIKDSHELAWQDWLGTAGFDRPEDEWPRRWAEAYVDWAAGEKREWLHAKGIRFLPNVGWAERGGGLANGPGNSVPRFHVTWGTGPGLIEPFVAAVREGERNGLVELRFRHRVDRLAVTNGAVDGVAGAVLAPDACARGRSSSRDVVGEFELARRRGDRHLGRDRGQPGTRPRQLARAPRHRADAHALRRSRPRRRPHDRDRAGGRRRR